MDSGTPLQNVVRVFVVALLRGESEISIYIYIYLYIYIYIERERERERERADSGTTQRGQRKEKSHANTREERRE